MPAAVSSRKIATIAQEPEVYFTSTALRPGLLPGLGGRHILGSGWFFLWVPIPIPVLPAVGMGALCI